MVRPSTFRKKWPGVLWSLTSKLEPSVGLGLEKWIIWGRSGRNSNHLYIKENAHPRKHKSPLSEHNEHRRWGCVITGGDVLSRRVFILAHHKAELIASWRALPQSHPHHRQSYQVQYLLHLRCRYGYGYAQALHHRHSNHRQRPLLLLRVRVERR